MAYIAMAQDSELGVTAHEVEAVSGIRELESLWRLMDERLTRPSEEPTATADDGDLSAAMNGRGPTTEAWCSLVDGFWRYTTSLVTCLDACLYTCLHSCLDTCLYTCPHTCLHICLWRYVTCLYTCLHTCLHTCLCTCLWRYTTAVRQITFEPSDCGRFEIFWINGANAAFFR